MSRPINEQAWHQMTEEIMSGIREWRLQHPRATLREMETELDTRWARVRARMLEDLALQSAAAAWSDEAADGHRPVCPQCTTPLHARGHQPRHLLTHGGHDLTLDRTYGTCPACGTGFFPPR